MKPFYKSKTFWFALGTGIVGFLQAAQEVPLDPKFSGLILSWIGIVNIALRFLTSTGIDQVTLGEHNGSVQSTSGDENAGSTGPGD